MDETANIERPISTRPYLYIFGTLLFIVFMMVGLFIVKWDPYFHKAFNAALKHSIGNSIITGTGVSAPAASWSAAWHYTVVYGKAVWEATIVGILAAAGVQTLVPRDWVVRLLGKTGLRSTLAAGAAAVPSMM